MIGWLKRQIQICKAIKAGLRHGKRYYTFVCVKGVYKVGGETCTMKQFDFDRVNENRVFKSIDEAKLKAECAAGYAWHSDSPVS